MTSTIINYKVLATAALLGLSVSPLLAERGDVVLSETFDTEADFARWEVVDLNGGRAWEYLNGTAAYMLDWQTFLPGDDWLISPAFELKPHTAYEVRFYMNVLTKVESLRMALAPSHDPAVMAQHFLAEYDHVTSADKGDKAVRICTGDTGGTYYLGYYAYSDPDQHRIEVDNVKLTELGPSTIPADITALTAQAATDGSLSATLQFTAPSLDADGQSLGELTAIDIRRGATLIHTIDKPAAGSTLTWTDASAQQGYNHYSVVARNSDGESQPATIDVYVGVDAPTAIARVSAKVQADRSVTVEWQAPTTSVHGGYVDYSAIRYRVKRNNKTIYTDLADTQFNDPTPGTNAQQGQVKYTITPVAGTMTGDATVSLPVVTGQPLTMPYVESFANRQMVAPWYQDEDAADFGWKRSADSEDEYAVSSQDKDNGFLQSESTYGDRGQQSRYVSPILDLSSLDQPVLTFWFYEGRDPWYDPEFQGKVNDRLQVQWRRLGGEWQELTGATYYQNRSSQGWVECEVALPHVADAAINLGLLAIADAEHYAYRDIAVDHITITEAPYRHDIRMDGLTAQQLRVTVGQELRLTAWMTNRADADATATVTLLRDGEPCQTATVTVGALQQTACDFSYLTTYADASLSEISWTATVTSLDDDVADNNTSAPLLSSVRHADVPTVEQLTARMTNQQDVLLSWQPATSVSGMAWSDPVTVTDSFDAYEPFAIEGFGQWTVADRDGATTLLTGRIPANYPHKGEPMAYQVFDAALAGVWCEGNYDDAFGPRSDGNLQYLLCPSTDYPAENDDWLITPRLDGRSHTVSFYAQAATYDAEWINVYYSLTDAHPDSFLPLTDEEQIFVHEGWHRYEYTVPDGAQYFAVRCIRRSVFLMIDDFTYNAYQGHEADRQLLGYHVYRNGERITAEPVLPASTDGCASFIDTVSDPITYTYRVTAVYDLGESPLSAEATVDAAAPIEAITADAAACPIVIYDLMGRRLQQAQKGLNVVNGQKMIVK